MSYWTDRELPDTKDKKEILRDFKAFCDWCWGMGFGNCDECKEELDNVLKNVTGESFPFKLDDKKDNRRRKNEIQKETS